MRPGRLIAVVGPSGVGKDSVMAALVAARPDLFLVRRVITRPAAAGGEDFEGVTPEIFARRAALGEFVLSWPAHGLRYGVPRAQMAPLQCGRDGLVNLSRAVLSEAAQRFAGFKVLSLTAAPETLAARLAERARETPEDIAARLARAATLPDGLDVIRIANDGALSETVDAALAALYPVRAKRWI